MTLLEVLVAIAAAVILVSLAVPGYNGYILRARVAKSVGDIGSISLQLYRWQLNTRTFPDTLTQAGLDALDPWGKPYAYHRITGPNDNDARKDHNLHPINTDFDLYSVGADGDTTGALTAKASRDDVIRANDGGFVGLAATYDP